MITSSSISSSTYSSHLPIIKLMKSCNLISQLSRVSEVEAEKAAGSGPGRI